MLKNTDCKCHLHITADLNRPLNSAAPSLNWAVQPHYLDSTVTKSISILSIRTVTMPRAGRSGFAFRQGQETSLHLVPRLRMSAAMPLLTLYDHSVNRDFTVTFTKTSRLTMRPIHPPVQWVLGNLSGR